MTFVSHMADIVPGRSDARAILILSHSLDVFYLVQCAVCMLCVWIAAFRTTDQFTYVHVVMGSLQRKGT